MAKQMDSWIAEKVCCSWSKHSITVQSICAMLTKMLLLLYPEAPNRLDGADLM